MPLVTFFFCHFCPVHRLHNINILVGAFYNELLHIVTLLVVEESPRMFDLYVEETLEDMDDNGDNLINLEEYLSEYKVVLVWEGESHRKF